MDGRRTQRRKDRGFAGAGSGPFALAVALAAFAFLEAGVPAWAKEPHAAAGLPQFDSSTFPQQIVWLLLAFAFLYVFFSRSTLPTLSRIIENRREHVQSDLAAAERLGAEADHVQKVYEESLEKARIEASGIVASATQSARHSAEDSLRQFQEKAEREIATAEKRVDKAIQNARESMNSAAAEAAALMIEKVAGLPGDLGVARSVVDDLTRKARAA